PACASLVSPALAPAHSSRLWLPKPFLRSQFVIRALDWQSSDALPGRGEDSVNHSRSHWRYGSLAKSARGVVRGNNMRLDGRGLVHADNLKISKTRLHRGTLLEVNFPGKGR